MRTSSTSHSTPSKKRPVKAAQTSRSGRTGGRSARGALASERAQLAGMVTSKVTERSQTTLPRGVRQVLGLRPGQRVGYVFDEAGVRLVNPAGETHDDPAIRQFLQFLGQHFESDPAGSMRSMPPALLERARAVTAGVSIDHDAPIDGAIAL